VHAIALARLLLGPDADGDASQVPVARVEHPALGLGLEQVLVDPSRKACIWSWQLQKPTP
jgi:hypothetical protein